MNQQIKPSEIVILASGAVAFILTLPFAHWWSFPSGFSGGWSAWSTDGNLFPLATYIPIIGLIMAVQIALAKFANVQFPPQVLGFNWPQIHLVLAFFALLVAIGFLIMGTPSGLDWGLGFWMGLLSSIGLMVGAVMQLMESMKPGAPGPYPGQPGPGQPPQQF